MIIFFRAVSAAAAAAGQRATTSKAATQAARPGAGIIDKDKLFCENVPSFIVSFFS